MYDEDDEDESSETPALFPRLIVSGGAAFLLYASIAAVLLHQQLGITPTLSLNGPAVVTIRIEEGA